MAEKNIKNNLNETSFFRIILSSNLVQTLEVVQSMANNRTKRKLSD